MRGGGIGKDYLFDTIYDIIILLKIFKYYSEVLARMINSPQSLDTNLSKLLDEVQSGDMQLPEFLG